MKIRWLLIDFDNTLMDTESHSIPVLIQRFNALYQDQIDQPLTQSLFQAHFHGMTGDALCAVMSDYFKIRIEHAQLFHDREKIMQSYYQALLSGVTMAPEVLTVLTACKAKGMTLALVTNNPLQRAFAAMRFAHNGQGAQLAALFGANFFHAHPVPKPDPDVYVRALSQLNADPDQSLAIEDSPTGARSARGAGIVTLGYTGLSTDPIHSQQRLQVAGCQSTFQFWPELLNQILYLIYDYRKITVN